MPYNPSVNDNSGQILAGFKTRSAEITAAGNEALTKGIVSGVTSAVGGITGGIMDNYTKAAENKMTSDYLDSMANYFSETGGVNGTPLMDDETLAKFSKANLSQKQGMIVPMQAQFENNLKMNYLNQQGALFGQRQAAQQQVPANQVPMPPSANPAIETAPSSPPASPYTFNPNIKTRSGY